MKKYAAALTSVAILTGLVTPRANAGDELPTVDVGGTLSQPRPEPQRRMYCEQVGSGLWDCEEEVCSDWSNLQSSCWVVVYHRDG